MKSALTILFTFLLVLGFTIMSSAAPQNYAVFQVGSNRFSLNNSEQFMDTISFTENNRIFVPVRYLAYACGIRDEDLRWDNEAKTVTLSMEGNVLSLQEGNNQLIGNGEALPMDVAPVLVGNRIFLPARPIAEFFGYTVEWEAASNAVLVYPPGGTRPQPPGPVNIVLVNKARKLDAGYRPGPLVDMEGFQISALPGEPLRKLLASARKQGITITVTSGYRSYKEQQALYDSRLKTSGPKIAASTVAPPGHSEHQTGLAVDLAGNSKTYSWLENNCWRYGFIIRYPRNKQGVTGYSYEPWHYRYVGIPIATFMHYKNIQTLEEFVNYIKAG